MNQIPCYIYREGRDFIFPPELAAFRHLVCGLAAPETPGSSAPPSPNPEAFIETQRLDEAELFLFPYDIGQYIDAGYFGGIEKLIASLPHPEGRGERRMVMDHADSTLVIEPRVCLFKVNLRREDKARAVVPWFELSEHVRRDSPSFDWPGIRYDSNFIGTYNNPVRRAAVLSIERDAPNLRFYAKDNGSIKVENGRLFNPRYSAEELRRRQNAFRKIIKQSWTVLCPPGIGPQSLRMYETMYLGRIPVLFAGNNVYPLENVINYGEFCAIFPLENFLETGAMLKLWLAGKTREQLQEQCILSCKTWNKYFRQETALKTLLSEASRKFGV